MKKTINISGKDYFMKASAFTQFAYKNETGRSLLNDLQSFINREDNQELEKVDDLIEILLDISYVMINEADPNQVSNKEEFMKSITDLFEDTTWITEVVQLAISPLSRGNIKES